MHTTTHNDVMRGGSYCNRLMISDGILSQAVYNGQAMFA